MPAYDLELYYKAVIRPVMEYCSIIWHTNINEDQTHRLDSIQRRAERIIGSTLNSNSNCQSVSTLTPLKERRDLHARHIFQSLLDPMNCIHDISPAPRDYNITNKLRLAPKLEIPFAETERHKRSFLINALANFQ